MVRTMVGVYYFQSLFFGTLCVWYQHRLWLAYQYRYHLYRLDKKFSYRAILTGKQYVFICLREVHYNLNSVSNFQTQTICKISDPDKFDTPNITRWYFALNSFFNLILIFKVVKRDSLIAWNWTRISRTNMIYTTHIGP